MKQLISDSFDFAKLIQKQSLYIDKTEYLWNLINSGTDCYFLSRPRRFGKSLTVSTLKYIFEGRKELFKGLAIYDKDYDWKPYPVIHLSLGNYNTCGNALADFPDYLMARLRNIADEFNIVMREHTPGDCFSELIRKIGKSAPVVILIDEYDKPILDNITNPDLPEIMKILKGFYSTIKDCNALERFVFVTGVSKFSHVSIFSDLNNLRDISMDREYATMLGFTQEELEYHFSELIAQYARRDKISVPEITEKIRDWYNGYRFASNAATVYNPVSVSMFMAGGEFRNYWIKTGLSDFLLQLARERKCDFSDLGNKMMSEDDLAVSSIYNIMPLPLMFQTGYLTIKSTFVDDGDTYFTLDYPNREVNRSFASAIMSYYLKTGDGPNRRFARDLMIALNAGDLESFHTHIAAFFAGIPFDDHRKDEYVFRCVFASIFRLLGVNIKPEDHTNRGSIDASIETDKYVYIFEFKLDRDNSALKQIHEKKYFDKFLGSGKTIYLIGVNFDRINGDVIDFRTEMMQ